MRDQAVLSPSATLPKLRLRSTAALLAAALCALPALSETTPVVKVQPSAMRMLEVATVQAPEKGQVVWAPAHVEFMPGQLDTVASPLQARVVTLHVQLGQTVKAGAPLATLVSAEALRTRHEVQAARLALGTAQAEYKRHQDMVARGVGTEVELRAAQAHFKEAEQELARANGTAALLGGDAGDRIVLRAPRDGVVAQFQANLGMQVEQGAVLFAVGNSKSLGLVANVFEMDLPNLKVGSTARVELPVRTEPVQAKVLQIGAVVDAESRRAPILLSLQGTDVQDNLRAGMQARVGIAVDRPPQMMVPIGAVLIKDESRTVVFVQTAEHSFEARRVVLGLPVRGWVPVISGLKDGERIVVRGALMLDGAASQML